METLTKTKLVLMLKDAIRYPENATHENEWLEAWQIFTQQLENLSIPGCSPKLLRTLSYTHVELESMRPFFENMPYEKNLAKIYYERALGTIQCEVRIGLLCLSYPALSIDKSSQPPSPLHLSKDYNLTDLVSIIATVHRMNVFCEDGQTKARLKTLIRIAEWAFNVSLTNYDVLRNAALNRNTKLTSFLDKLRETFIEMSQK